MNLLAKLISPQAEKVFRKLSATGFRRGASGNGVWLAIGIVVTGFRFMNKLGKREREIVFTQVLKPGETFKIAHLLEDRKGRPVT
jgi:hypothetical protein